MDARHVVSLLMVFLILMMVYGVQRLREIANDLNATIKKFSLRHANLSKRK